VARLRETCTLPGAASATGSQAHRKPRNRFPYRLRPHGGLLCGFAGQGVLPRLRCLGMQRKGGFLASPDEAARSIFVIVKKYRPHPNG
jgi:hypothetical protein